MSGRLYGIGVGPGDPELMTIKAVNLLRDTAVIAYPASSEGNSLARKIAAPYLSNDKTEIVITLAMDPKNHPDHQAYDRAAEEISAQLHRDRDVAVLCEGDPLFYGSFMYLCERLAPSFEVVVVPGVTSLTASAAALLKPLVGGNEILTVLPAPMATDDLRRGLENCQTAAIIKLRRHGAKVLALLEEMNLLDESDYVEFASHDGEKIVSARELDASAVVYFSMLIVRRGKTDT